MDPIKFLNMRIDFMSVKKISIYCFVSALLFSNNNNAQSVIKNSGFENWNSGVPLGWKSNIDKSKAGDAFDKNDKKIMGIQQVKNNASQGNSYILLTSFELRNSSVPQAPNKLYGSYINQLVVTDNQYKSLTFDAKHAINSGDEGWAAVYVFGKDNKVIGNQSVYFNGKKNVNWQQITIPLKYDGIAQKYSIFIVSSENQINRFSKLKIIPGSWIAIDNIKLVK